MQRYETLMVLHPELPEAQVRETIDRARRLVEQAGGQQREAEIKSSTSAHAFSLQSVRLRPPLPESCPSGAAC